MALGEGAHRPVRDRLGLGPPPGQADAGGLAAHAGTPGEIILSTDKLDVRLDDFAVDEKLGQRYPRKVGVHTDTQGVTMDLRITTKRMVEQMKLPKVTEWDQYYLRFLADFRLDVQIDGVKDAAAGEMLHEYVIMYPGSDEE